MSRMPSRGLAILLSILLAPIISFAGSATITIHADQPGPTVSPLLYGIFFEEINRAGDGGLYAEMVQNRSFEDADEPVGWEIVGSASIDRDRPLNEMNPRSLRISPKARL